ncbi:MAG TPA: hypothetical protein VEB21_13675 [Terriglobales bacterium]|nr:hypothetical protein [Terriglobales bacterium]
MKGREAVLSVFDRLFARAAIKLGVTCDDGDLGEAKRQFEERFAAPLEVAAQLKLEVPEEVVQSMEEAIDHISPAQLVGHIASIPIAHQAQQLAQVLAHRAAEQKLVEHLISQADDSYGGN